MGRLGQTLIASLRLVQGTDCNFNALAHGVEEALRGMGLDRRSVTVEGDDIVLFDIEELRIGLSLAGDEDALFVSMGVGPSGTPGLRQATDESCDGLARALAVRLEECLQIDLVLWQCRMGPLTGDMLDIVADAALETRLPRKSQDWAEWGPNIQFADQASDMTDVDAVMVAAARRHPGHIAPAPRLSPDERAARAGEGGDLGKLRALRHTMYADQPSRAASIAAYTAASALLVMIPPAGVAMFTYATLRNNEEDINRLRMPQVDFAALLPPIRMQAAPEMARAQAVNARG